MSGPGGAWLTVRCGDGRRTTDEADQAQVAVSAGHLAAWLADPTSRRAALGMFEAVTGCAPGASLALVEPDLHRAVAMALERAFRQGRLVAELGPRPGCASPGGAAVARRGALAPNPLPVAAPAAARRTAEATRTWIEIVLVDEVGRPVAHERCHLRLPDGTVRAAQLDGAGRLRIDGIAPGSCEVSFPDREGRDWQEA